MLSFLALLFFVPAGVLLWIPMLSLLWGDHPDDYFMLGVTGLSIGWIGLGLVAVHHFIYRKRFLLVSVLGVAFMFSAWIIGPLVGGYCDLDVNRNICGRLIKSKAFWPIEPSAAGPLNLQPIPGAPGFEAAMLIGSQNTAGPYLRRFVLKAGMTVKPARHSDDRIISVKSGTLWVGPGPAGDTEEQVVVEAGQAFLVPRGFIYGLAAQAGDVTFDVSGTGPTQDFTYPGD
jgi:hypothetical protein